MESQEFVNVEEVMREIRERACQRRERTPSFARAPLVPLFPSVLENFPVSRIGEMPPHPPTVRARIGAVVVRIAYHILHWYTVRLREFATAVTDYAAAQGDAVRSLGGTLEDVGRAVESNTKEVEALRARITELEQQLAQVKSDDLPRIERTALKTQAGQIVQDRRISMLLEEARKRLPAPFDREQLERFASENSPTLDALYSSFEDQFRGSREEIAERLRFYLPYLPKAKSVLDIGCGRGEWLELLRTEGVPGEGVDSNPVMVERCRERGLTVEQADFLDHLRSRPEKSIGAITCFHMIEHLPWDIFVALLDESLRLLCEGGVLILETPNPENLLVAGHNFYMDPTHLRPLPSPLTRFMVEQRGFCRVEMIPLHPYPSSLTVPADGSEVVSRLNYFLYGPQDYAVIARRP